MPLFNLPDLIPRLRAPRLLGLDPGARRIGVALSDISRWVATPYGTLHRARLRHNAAEILAVAEAEGAGGLIIGLPLEEDGRMGPAAQAARDWAHALTAATGLPGCMWDETLTTAETTAMLIEEADLGRQRRAAIIDKMAAARILQSALDTLHAPLL